MYGSAAAIRRAQSHGWHHSADASGSSSRTGQPMRVGCVLPMWAPVGSHTEPFESIDLETLENGHRLARARSTESLTPVAGRRENSARDTIDRTPRPRATVVRTSASSPYNRY